MLSVVDRVQTFLPKLATDLQTEPKGDQDDGEDPSLQSLYEAVIVGGRQVLEKNVFGFRRSLNFKESSVSLGILEVLHPVI